jgi:hypothetical protein
MLLRREERKSCKWQDTLIQVITNYYIQGQENKNSPLLRLPPELRGRIWELAIGSPVLRGVLGCSSPKARYDIKLNPSFSERENVFALLGLAARSTPRLHSFHTRRAFSVLLYTTRDNISSDV